MQSSLFLWFCNESTLLQKLCMISWTTTLHKKNCRSFRLRSGQTVRSWLQDCIWCLGVRCDYGSFTHTMCMGGCSKQICFWSVWGQPPCLQEETENTPDYRRFRTELLSVSEKSYKNERGDGHMNKLWEAHYCMFFLICR